MLDVPKVLYSRRTRIDIIIQYISKKRFQLLLKIKQTFENILKNCNLLSVKTQLMLLEKKLSFVITSVNAKLMNVT